MHIIFKKLGFKKILLAIISLFFLASCWTQTSLDVLNPDADYIYFYWKTCPHCVNVNKHFTENDIMNKYLIEKREVWYNKTNKLYFDQIVESLWLIPEDQWVPFLLRKDDKKYFIWDKDIIELFKWDVPLLEKNK